MKYLLLLLLVMPACKMPTDTKEADILREQLNLCEVDKQVIQESLEQCMDGFKGAAYIKLKDGSRVQLISKCVQLGDTDYSLHYICPDGTVAKEIKTPDELPK